MTDFIRDLLLHYRMVPSQLLAGGWHVVLSFQALCNMFFPGACRVEDFYALYMIRRNIEDGRFFSVRSGSERLIVNLADSDHGWRDTVIRVHGV